MGPSLAELLHDWHDFYLLVGTASATLVGLMFVAASIGSSIFDEDHRAGLTAFITPTVVHFAAVLFTCLLINIPTQSWRTLGGLIGAGGLAGAIYCGRLVVSMVIRHRFNVDLIDRLFYALLPLLGYLLALTAAGVPREEAYRIVQRNAMKIWNEGGDFLAVLLADKDVSKALSEDQVRAQFDLGYHTKHVDTIFERVFG